MVDHLQTRVVAVGVRAFGIDSMSCGEERTLRFAEEAFELMQARGLSLTKITELITHVYSRPVGETAQEIAGVACTLYALAHNEGVYVEDALKKEIDRIDRNIGKIRAKASLKPDRLFAVRPIAPEGGDGSKIIAPEGGGGSKIVEKIA